MSYDSDVGSAVTQTYNMSVFLENLFLAIVERKGLVTCI